ncbi:MAG: Mov34/MPN/PAD-1 family protein [Burkholderiales bacterium]
MIEWREEAAAPLAKPLDALYAGLAAADVIAIEARLNEVPLVVVASAARQTVANHLGRVRTEQGGLLAGVPFARDPASAKIAVVLVRAAIAATDFEGSGVSLRMESGVWDRARTALRDGEVVIGWYHSHPGLTAFFSETDRRTQRAFFNHPFSLGWVVDPLAHEEAWFRSGESTPVESCQVLALAERDAVAQARSRP